MNTNNPLGQGIAAVGAFAKPLDIIAPGLGTGIGAALQVGSMLLPDTTNYFPINPYNTNQFGKVGAYKYGGDMKLSSDSYQVGGSPGIDTNFRMVEGVPAFLTKNEVVAKRPNGENYVLSNHIKMPGTNMTLAELGKKNKKAKGQAEDRAKLGDIISKKTVQELDKQFEGLVNVNEQALNMINSYMDTPNAMKFLHGGNISRSKAKEILHDGTVHGHPLTDKQRKFFGAVASGYSNGGPMTKLNKNEEATFQEWRKSLPQNLQTDNSMYDLRGAWKGGLEPELIDGEWHLGSRNPDTGQLLKSPEHPTYDKMIQGEIQAGYTPSIDLKSGQMKSFADGGPVDPRQDNHSQIITEINRLAAMGIPYDNIIQQIDPLLKQRDQLVPNNAPANPADYPSSNGGDIINPRFFKNGGEINIKKANRGKFTESAKRHHMGVQEYAHKVVNNPNASETERKRAQFAINASKFHHQFGGASELPPRTDIPNSLQYQIPTVYASRTSNIQDPYTDNTGMTIPDTLDPMKLRIDPTVWPKWNTPYTPKQGDLWTNLNYGTDPSPVGPPAPGMNPYPAINVASGVAQGAHDYAQGIGRLIWGPNYTSGMIGPEAIVKSHLNNNLGAFNIPGNNSPQRGIGASAYDPSIDPAMQKMLGWQQYAIPNNGVTNPVTNPLTTTPPPASTSQSTPSAGTKGTGTGSKTKSSSIGSEIIPGTEQLTAGKDPSFAGYNVKDFQTWVLGKDPKILNKYGVDGKWGKETEAAWKKYGKDYLTFTGDFGVKPTDLLTKKNSDPSLSKDNLDKVAAQAKYDLEMSQQFPKDQNNIDYRRYVGDVLQGLAFAGAQANLGPATWEQYPGMDTRQIDPRYMQDRIRAARTAALQQTGSSYTTNQTAKLAATSDSAQQETNLLLQVAQQNKQLAAEAQQYNNQASVNNQISRLQAIAARDNAKQVNWQSLANMGQAVNDQYANQVGMAALGSAYPLVYEGLMKDMQDFLKNRNNKTSE